jgi:hypothetical protein
MRNSPRTKEENIDGFSKIESKRKKKWLRQRRRRRRWRLSACKKR